MMGDSGRWWAIVGGLRANDNENDNNNKRLQRLNNPICAGGACIGKADRIKRRRRGSFCSRMFATHNETSDEETHPSPPS